MHWWESEWLEVRTFQVPTLSNLGRAIRLVHISDLHASEEIGLDYLGGSLDKIGLLKPALICLTGDYITAQFDDFTGYTKVLRKLPNVPKFATFGNHDGGAWAYPRGGYRTTDKVRETLENAGIQILHNQLAEKPAGLPLKVAGVGDLWANEMIPNGPLLPKEGKAGSAAFTVLLCHNPDSKENLGAYQWDLMLSGHTHGGQLRLPIVGTPFAPVRDMRFVKGLNPWDGRWIHTTKGIGNLHGMRLNCRPDITVLEITPG